MAARVPTAQPQVLSLSRLTATCLRLRTPVLPEILATAGEAVEAAGAAIATAIPMVARVVEAARADAVDFLAAGVSPAALLFPFFFGPQTSVSKPAL